MATIIRGASDSGNRAAAPDCTRLTFGPGLTMYAWYAVGGSVTSRVGIGRRPELRDAISVERAQTAHGNESASIRVTVRKDSSPARQIEPQRGTRQRDDAVIEAGCCGHAGAAVADFRESIDAA